MTRPHVRLKSRRLSAFGAPIWELGLGLARESRPLGAFSDRLTHSRLTVAWAGPVIADLWTPLRWERPLGWIRLQLARLLVVAMMLAAAACTNDGTVNWHVVQTTDAASPTPSCPPGMVAYPVAADRGFVCDTAGPSSSPSPLPTGPDGKDYVPYCLPSDPPGSYCQAAP